MEAGRMPVFALVGILLAGSAGIGITLAGDDASPSMLKMNLGRSALEASSLSTSLWLPSPGALLPQAHGFGPVTVVNGSDFGGEPGIDVAPNGVLYENAPSGLGGITGSWLYKSSDGGASWTKCAPTTGPGGGDSNVAINPQGTIAMNDLWVGSLTFYISTNGCSSWTAIPISTPRPIGDRQWVDHGWASNEWFQSWNTVGSGIHVMHSTNNGLTWDDSTAASADLIGNLVVDHSGATHNVYQFFTTGGAIKVAIGTVSTGILGGMTWTTKVIAPAITGHKTADSFPAGAVDAAGNLHVVWTDIVTSTKDYRTAYASSTTQGATWAAPSIISTGGSNIFPWITAGGAGKVDAVWYHSDTAGDPNTNNGPWFVHLSQALSLGGPWTESRATPLSIHNDHICTGGTSCSGDDRDLLDFFEVAKDANGFAVIAFAKDTDANGGGNGNPRNAFVAQTSGPSLN